MEYKENVGDKETAKDSFIEICKDTQIPCHIFVGYILHNAFSQDLDGWNVIFDLVINHLFIKEQLFSEKDLLEG